MPVSSPYCSDLVLVSWNSTDNWPNVDNHNHIQVGRRPIYTCRWLKACVGLLQLLNNVRRCSDHTTSETSSDAGSSYNRVWFGFDYLYRAMHFSVKRGIAIACRPSLCPSVTLVDCDHIGWNSSKIISPLVSLGRSLFATPTWRVCSKANAPKFGPKVTHPLLIGASETFDCKLRPNGYK